MKNFTKKWAKCFNPLASSSVASTQVTRPPPRTRPASSPSLPRATEGRKRLGWGQMLKFPSSSFRNWPGKKKTAKSCGAPARSCAPGVLTTRGAACCLPGYRRGNRWRETAPLSQVTLPEAKLRSFPWSLEGMAVSGSNVRAQSSSCTSGRRQGGRQTCGQAGGWHSPEAKPVGSGATV